MTDSEGEALSPGYTAGRIDQQLLAQTLEQLQQKAAGAAGGGTDNPFPDVVSYLCGPPAMADNMAETLQRVGLASTSIFYEKWW